jgi:hypothetical protein
MKTTCSRSACGTVTLKDTPVQTEDPLAACQMEIEMLSSKGATFLAFFGNCRGSHECPPRSDYSQSARDQWQVFLNNCYSSIREDLAWSDLRPRLVDTSRMRRIHELRAADVRPIYLLQCRDRNPSEDPTRTPETCRNSVQGARLYQQ